VEGVHDEGGHRLTSRARGGLATGTPGPLTGKRRTLTESVSPHEHAEHGRLAEGGVEELLDELLYVPVLVHDEDGEREVPGGDDGQRGAVPRGVAEVPEASATPLR
jgi:hypothetical protein